MTLSDILANGVIILLILIITTIISEKEKESIKVEQAKEITVILSREIASSLVMNSLKSSPPSVLHDYHNSPLDNRIIKENIPIFELLNNGVYEVQSQKFWTKKVLLTQDSSLDNYLSSLSAINKMLFRVDIYDITNYYLFISILEDHNLRPKHWHFMGEKMTSEYGRSALNGIDNESNDHSLNGEGADKNNLLSSKNSSGTDFEEEASNLSEESLSDYSNEKSIDESYITQDSLNIGDNHSYEKNYDLLDASLQKKSMINIVGMSNLKSNKNNIDFIDSLALVYAIMIHTNSEITNKSFHSLEKLKTIEINNISEYIRNTNDFKYWASDIFHLINVGDYKLSNNIFMNEEAGGFAAIGLYENRRVNEIELYNSSISTLLENESQEFLEINLNTYPLPHKGNRVKINSNSILLYADNKKNEKLQWRLVGVLDSKSYQVTLGLVYSEYDNNTGELILPAEENKPSVQGNIIATNKPPIVSKSVKVAIILFISLSILFFLFASKIFKRVYHEK